MATQDPYAAYRSKYGMTTLDAAADPYAAYRAKYNASLADAPTIDLGGREPDTRVARSVLGGQTQDLLNAANATGPIQDAFGAMAPRRPQEDVSRLPTIPEARQAARTAGRPFRLGSPTGEQTVMLRASAQAQDIKRTGDEAVAARDRSLPGIVERAVAKNPIVTGAQDLYGRLGPIVAPSEDEAQAIRDWNAERLATEEPGGMVRSLVRGAVAYAPEVALGGWGAAMGTRALTSLPAVARIAAKTPLALRALGRIAASVNEAGMAMAPIPVTEALSRDELPSPSAVAREYAVGAPFGLLAAPFIARGAIKTARAARAVEQAAEDANRFNYESTARAADALAVDEARTQARLAQPLLDPHELPPASMPSPVSTAEEVARLEAAHPGVLEPNPRPMFQEGVAPARTALEDETVAARMAREKFNAEQEMYAPFVEPGPQPETIRGPGAVETANPHTPYPGELPPEPLGLMSQDEVMGVAGLPSHRIKQKQTMTETANKARDVLAARGRSDLLAPREPTRPVEASAPVEAVPVTPEPVTPVVEAPATTVREPWQMTRDEFRLAENQPKVDAIQTAIRQGQDVVLATNTRATRLASPDYIRVSPDGTVRIPSGKKWVALTGDQVDALAAQAGVRPVPLSERVYHQAAVEDAVASGKPVPPEVLAQYPDLVPRASTVPDVTPEVAAPVATEPPVILTRGQALDRIGPRGSAERKAAALLSVDELRTRAASLPEPLVRPETVTPKIWRETRTLPEAEWRARLTAERKELDRLVAVQNKGEMPHRRMGKAGSRFAGIQAIGKNSVVAQLEEVGRLRGFNTEAPPASTVMSAEEVLARTSPDNPLGIARDQVTDEMVGRPYGGVILDHVVNSINDAARSGASLEEALSKLSPEAQAFAAEAPEVVRARYHTARERFARGEPLGITTDEMLTSLAGAAGSAAGGGLIGAGMGNTPEEKHRNALLGAGVGLVAGAALPFLIRPPAPRTSSALTPAERAVLSRVGSATPEPRAVGDVIGGIYADLVRGTYKVEKATQTLGAAKNPTFHNPGEVAMLASGSAVRTEEFLAGGGAFRYTPDGEIVRTGTPSLKAILAPLRDVRGGVDALEAYEVARHALDLEALGKKTGVPLPEARATVAGASPEVVTAHENLVKLRNDALDYWVAEGGLSPEAATAMKTMYENYVPFQRVFSEQRAGQGAGRPGAISQVVKRITGSDRRIRDVIATTEQQVARMIEAADRNRVFRVLVEAAEANPTAAQGLLQRETTSAQAAGQYARKLQKMAAANGVTLTDAAAQQIANTMASGELHATGGRMSLWRNGTQESWHVEPELAKSLSSLGPYQAHLFVRLLGLGARTLKAGITLDPVFSAFNAIRDTFDATIQSKAKFRPGVDSAIGFWNAMRETPVYQELRAGGLGFSNTIRGRIRSDASAMRLVMPTGVGGKVVSKVLHPLEALADFARPFEEAARVGEAMRIRKAGGTVADAVRGGQEITTNFQQVGLKMQGFAHMTAFLNPAVQSLDRAFRVAGGDAYALARATGGTRSASLGQASKAAGRVMALGAGAVSIPSILFWIAGKDDQEIQDARKTNAGLIYWFVRDPSGQIRHIPKPFLWGQIFGTGVEAVLDKLYSDDPEAMNRWAQGLTDQVTTNVVPTALQQIDAQRRNKAPFFNTPIVPPELLDNVEPRYQASERTGLAARAVAEGVGKLGDRIGNEALSRSVSPARIEALVRGFGGRLAGYGLQAADRLLDTGETGDAPKMQAVDVPVVGRFSVRTPSTGVKPVQDFYEQLRVAREAANTLKLIEQSGDIGRADTYAREHLDVLDRYADLDATAKAMREIRQEQEIYRTDPQMSGEEKRRRIDELTRELVAIARDAMSTGNTRSP